MKVVSNETGKALQFTRVKVYGSLVGQTDENGGIIFPIADCISTSILILKQTYYDPLFVSTLMNLEKQYRFEFKLLVGQVNKKCYRVTCLKWHTKGAMKGALRKVCESARKFALRSKNIRFENRALRNTSAQKSVRSENRALRKA